MGITYGDHLIDSGYYDITPEQENEGRCKCYYPGDCDGSCTHPPPVEPDEPDDGLDEIAADNEAWRDEMWGEAGE